MPLTKILVFAAISLFLVALGILLWCGKGAWMIAGYNTSSKAEKAKYDEKALCRFVAKLLWAMALFFFVLGFIENLVVHLALCFAFIIFIFGAVIYANTGNRFKKK